MTLYYTEKDTTSTLASSGGTATLACPADGQVSWNFKGGELPNNARPYHVPGTGCNVLVVTDAKREHSGQYSCMGTDGGRLFYSHINLAVEGK